MPAPHLDHDFVRAWLNDYAWMGTDAEKAATVACIMAQEDTVSYVDALSERYAGQAFEPGPDAYAAGQDLALSSLYECHDAPHLPDCPSLAGYAHHRDERDHR